MHGSNRLMSVFQKYQALLFALIAFLLYLGTLNHGFVWDDQIVITQNTYTMEGLEGFKDIWTNNSYILQRSTYRPVPQSLYALEWEFFESNPKIFHFVQILLYAFCCFSFVLAIQRFFPKVNNWVIGLSGLFFILSPVHTEVVANIKSGDEILSAIFAIWALLFAFKKKWYFKFFAIALFILALLSKVSAITVSPIFLFLLFKENTLLSWAKTYISKYNKYIEVLVLFIFILTIYLRFYGLYFLVPLVILVYLLKFKINKASWFHFIIALLLILVLRVYTSATITLFFALLWFSQLENKKTSLNNYPLIFISLFAIIGFTENLGSIPSLLIGIFLAYVIYKNQEKKKITLISFLLPLAFTIYLVVQVFLKETSIVSSSLLELRTLLLFCSPFLLYFLSVYLKKHAELVLLGVFLFIVFSKSDFNYVESFRNELQDFEIIQQLKPTINEIEFANEPYHNILVSIDGNGDKIATIIKIQLIYLQKLVLPIHLVHQHGTWQVKPSNWKDGLVYLSIVIHIVLLLLGYFFYKKKYFIVMWGILWYFLSISIYTNIFRLMPDTLAERFLFLPSLGFSIAFVASIFYFIKKTISNETIKFLVLGLFFTPLFAYFTYKTVIRSQDWKSNYTLAANTLPYAKNNAAINAQYALELNNLMKYNIIEESDSAQELVIKHYKKACELFPDFYGPNADLANYYIYNAEPDKAFPFLLESVRLTPNEWSHHYYLGLIYYERNKYTESISHFAELIANETLQSRALEFPELLESYEYSARCCHNIGKDEAAYKLLNEGISKFNQPSTYILLANLYRVTGKTDLAIETFKKLLMLDPNNQELINTINYLEQGLIY